MAVNSVQHGFYAVIVVNRIYCMALFHSQMRRNMINAKNGLTVKQAGVYARYKKLYLRSTFKCTRV